MLPHESQCQKNHYQPLKRIAERGGFSPSEAWCCVNGLRLCPIHDSDVAIEMAKKNWFELAERVNREWAIEKARREALEAAAIKVEAYFTKSANFQLRDSLAAGIRRLME